MMYTITTRCEYCGVMCSRAEPTDRPYLCESGVRIMKDFLCASCFKTISNKFYELCKSWVDQNNAAQD